MSWSWSIASNYSLKRCSVQWSGDHPPAGSAFIWNQVDVDDSAEDLPNKLFFWMRCERLGGDECASQCHASIDSPDRWRHQEQAETQGAILLASATPHLGSAPHRSARLRHCGPGFCATLPGANETLTPVTQTVWTTPPQTSSSQHPHQVSCLPVRSRLKQVKLTTVEQKQRMMIQKWKGITMGLRDDTAIAIHSNV